MIAITFIRFYNDGNGFQDLVKVHRLVEDNKPPVYVVEYKTGKLQQVSEDTFNKMKTLT